MPETKFSPKIEKYLKDNMPKGPREFIVAKLVKSDVQDKGYRIRGSSATVVKAKNANGKSFIGKEVFFDEGESDFAKRQKVLTYTIGQRTEYKNGEEVITPQAGYVDFNSRAVCVARGDEPEKARFILLSSHNRDNPFRNPNMSAEWYIVTDNKEVEDDSFTFELIDRGIEKLSKTTHDERLAIATKLAARGSKAFMGRMKEFEESPSFLKTQLRRFIDQDPKEFSIAAEDTVSMKKIQIREARRKHFLKLDSTENFWYLENDLGEVLTDSGKKLVCQFEAIDDPMAALEKFLNTKEGSLFYRKMVDLIK